MRLELGQPVRCDDGAFGDLADVVIDPITKRVTHVVAKPKGQEVMTNRLVPVDLIDPSGDGNGILLRCTLAEAAKLESVQEFAYLRLGGFPVGDPEWDVGAEDVLASPYYEGTGFGEYAGDFGGMDAIVYDRVPKGEVEIRRSSAVYSSDGHHLGHVDGFVVDDTDQIAQLVLERGHLWGRREVTIPIGAVETVASDEVRLSLSRDQVGAMPAIRVHRWGAHKAGSDS
jgi:sporulation protein YlmC with PRC-barrel domain